MDGQLHVVDAKAVPNDVGCLVVPMAGMMIGVMMMLRGVTMTSDENRDDNKTTRMRTKLSHKMNI